MHKSSDAKLSSVPAVPRSPRVDELSKSVSFNRQRGNSSARAARVDSQQLDVRFRHDGPALQSDLLSEDNTVSDAEPLVPEDQIDSRVPSGYKTLNDIYQDKIAKDEKSYTTSYIEAWKLQNITHYKHMVQLRSELRRCLTELSGNVYDLLAFKDIFIEMSATAGVTLTNGAQQSTGKAPPMKMNMPYHIVSDLILLSSKFYRKTSDMYWRMTEFFNLVFHFEPAATYQLVTQLPSQQQQQQQQTNKSKKPKKSESRKNVINPPERSLDCELNDNFPLDYDYDFMGYRQIMRQYEHKSAETEVYKSQVGELDRYIQEVLEPKIKFHITQVQELTEKNTKLREKLKYYEGYASELYEKLSDSIIKREDIKAETKVLDNETNDVKINRLGFSVSEGMRTAHQKLGWFSELLSDIMSAPSVRLDKDVMGKLNSMQVHVMHLLKRFDGRMQDGWLYVAQELDKAINKKLEYTKQDKTQWKTYKSEAVNLKRAREIVQLISNCVVEISEFHSIHLDTTEEDFATVMPEMEPPEINTEDVKGVLMHMNNLIEEYNDVMYQGMPNVELIKTPREKRIGGILNATDKKTIDAILSSAIGRPHTTASNLTHFTQMSASRKNAASSNVSMLTVKESENMSITSQEELHGRRLSRIFTQQTKEEAEKKSPLSPLSPRSPRSPRIHTERRGSKEFATRSPRKSTDANMSPWAQNQQASVELDIPEEEEELLPDGKEDETEYLDSISKLKLGSENVNSLRVVHTSVDNISRLKDIHNQRVKNVKRVYDDKIIDLEKRVIELHKQLQFYQQTSGMSVTSLQDMMLMLKYGRGRIRRVHGTAPSNSLSPKREKGQRAPKTAAGKLESKDEHTDEEKAKLGGDSPQTKTQSDVLVLNSVEPKPDLFQFTPQPPKTDRVTRQSRYAGYMRGLVNKKKPEKVTAPDSRFTERHIHGLVSLQDTIKIQAVDAATGKTISREQLEIMLEQELADLDGRFPPISAKRRDSHIYREEHIVPDHLKKSIKNEKRVPVVDLVIPSDVLSSVAERERSPR
jgi:hypothetical protein